MNNKIKNDDNLVLINKVIYTEYIESLSRDDIIKIITTKDVMDEIDPECLKIVLNARDKKTLQEKNERRDSI